MKHIIHLVAAITATLCIGTFFFSSIIVELTGTNDSIAAVKSLIVFPGLFILIPAIAATGGTGFLLARNRTGRLVEKKKRRMPIIGINGIFILLPAAIILNYWASDGLFDTRFYLVQGLELIAGAINLTLMGKNIRDGFKLAGKLRHK
jgi:hypothetical protein